MKPILPRMRHWLLVALITMTGAAAPAAASEAERRPNFLIIVADDLGYSDLGAFGGEIPTPNLDAIAQRGLRLTAFHTAPTCSPTRSMLLSGTDNHIAGLGTMAELISSNQRGRPGYEGYLRADVATLAERFLEGGYRTLLSGKWHLGVTPEQDPSARGFQHSFALLQGGHNHFGTNLTTDPGLAIGATYRENGRVLESLPADFYSSDYFATRLIDFLGQSRQGDGASQPFFAYLAFTAPHWPLQAPAEDIARHRGRYDAGFEVLRQQRLRRQVELGLIPADVAAHEPSLPFGRWDDLTDEQKRTASRNMEVYAAMVERLDRNVGRVIEELRRTGELDNTIILFLADNGAEGMDLENGGLARLAAGLQRSGGDGQQAPSDTGRRFLEALSRIDNSIDNRGSATSYIGYGPGWAQAATAPSWLFKAYQTEGGTRAVAFIAGPGIGGNGAVTGSFLSVQDVAPTFLELAGIDSSTTNVAGRAVRPITGRSWTGLLNGSTDRVYGDNDGIGAELFGSRAFRQGDWKITDIGDGQWRLFNIARDPGETRDLAAEHPQRLSALVAAWDAYARDHGVILPSTPPLARPL